MTLREQFDQDLKQAMRARDQKRVSTLRLVLAALKDRDIASRSQDSREGIGEDEILALLAKMIKQREESATAFEAGGRPELAAAERGEDALSVSGRSMLDALADAREGRDLHVHEYFQRRDLHFLGA